MGNWATKRECLWGKEVNYGQEFLKLIIYFFAGKTDCFSKRLLAIIIIQIIPPASLLQHQKNKQTKQEMITLIYLPQCQGHKSDSDALRKNKL